MLFYFDETLLSFTARIANGDVVTNNSGNATRLVLLLWHLTKQRPHKRKPRQITFLFRQIFLFAE